MQCIRVSSDYALYKSTHSLTHSLTNYLVVGNASTDGSINDTIEHHAKRVDFKSSVGKVLFN